MAKRGRPPKDDSRDYKYCLRLNSEDEARLRRICEKTGMGRSDVLRTLIEKYGGDEDESR